MSEQAAASEQAVIQSLEKRIRRVIFPRAVGDKMNQNSSSSEVEVPVFQS